MPTSTSRRVGVRTSLSCLPPSTVVNESSPAAGVSPNSV
jgi:hypothetical protein